MFKIYNYFLNIIKKNIFINYEQQTTDPFILCRPAIYSASELSIYNYSSSLDILYLGNTVTNEDINKFITYLYNPIYCLEEFIFLLKNTSIKGCLLHGNITDELFFPSVNEADWLLFLEKYNYYSDGRDFCIIAFRKEESYRVKIVAEAVCFFTEFYTRHQKPPIFSIFPANIFNPNCKTVNTYFYSDSLYFLYDKEVINDEINYILNLLIDLNIDKLIDFLTNPNISIKGILYTKRLFQIPPSNANMLLLLNNLHNYTIIGVFQDDTNPNKQPMHWQLNSVANVVYQIIIEYEFCTGKNFVQFLLQKNINKIHLINKNLLIIIYEYKQYYEEWILLPCVKSPCCTEN